VIVLVVAQIYKCANAVRGGQPGNVYVGHQEVKVGQQRTRVAAGHKILYL
jgi:hypothetical protein